MSEFVEVKTADLVGASLDWAVGYAVRWHDRDSREAWAHDWLRCYCPSTDWGQGGPLIEKYMRNSGVFCDGLWQHVGFYKCSFEDGGAVSIADTPLIAACRAIVASVLGETVSVPKELLS